jgi:WD40 repeat protein
MDSERILILYLSVNPLAPCINVGTNKGFIVYNLEKSFRCRVNRSMEGGIGLVEQYRKTNIFALTGGGDNPWNPPITTLSMWDDSQCKVIGTICPGEPILRVQFSMDYLFCIFRRKICVYLFKTLAIQRTIVTIDNPYGLGCLTIRGNVISLGIRPGEIYWEQSPSGRSSEQELRNLSDPSYHPVGRVINLHRDPIRQMAVDGEGKKLATCSTRGTTIRVVNLETGAILYSLRRGTFVVDIVSLSFDSTAEQLWVGSRKNTIHSFDLTGTPMGNHRTFETKVSGGLIVPITGSILIFWVDNKSTWRPGYVAEYIPDSENKNLVETRRLTFPN